MKRTPSAKTSSVGVTRTKLAVEEELGWLFREQPTEDYGIDAHVELVDDDQVLGRLLGLQIKSGNSWFREPGPNGWWFRPKPKHVRYWVRHSLPVVVVLYHSGSRRCYWQVVNNETLVPIGDNRWKLLVPKSRRLDHRAASLLRDAAEGDPYELRLRELRLSRPWMEMLQEGMRLVIDIEEWVNKTSGRGSITLGIDNEDGNDPTPLASWGVFLGLNSYADAVPALFPWAEVDLHEETYDEADHDQWEEECVVYDEGDRLEMESFADWTSTRPRELRPFANGAGEVDYWRMELSLNELGRSFMIVDEFAMGSGLQLTPSP